MSAAWKHGLVSWDEAFADRYEEWSAEMTADIAFYVALARHANGPLVELAVAGRSGIMLLEPADQSAEFGDFLSALPSVSDEENDDDHQSGNERFEALRESADGAPGDNCKTDGD